MFDRIKRRALILSSDKNKRDWGSSITIRSEGSKIDSSIYGYREKFLTFKPKASIMLESHAGYNEVWVTDSSFGYYLEDRNGQIIKHVANEFERTFIPKGHKHKIINPNETQLYVFEIQMGQVKDDDKIQYIEEDKNA